MRTPFFCQRHCGFRPDHPGIRKTVPFRTPAGPAAIRSAILIEADQTLTATACPQMTHCGHLGVRSANQLEPKIRAFDTDGPKAKAIISDHPLLQPDSITAADHATPEHRGIDTHIGLIVLGCRSQDTHILWEIALGQSRHDAPRAGAIDT